MGTGEYAPTDKGTFSTHMFRGLILKSHLFCRMISTLECSVHFTFYHPRSTPKSVGFVFLFFACCSLLFCAVFFLVSKFKHTSLHLGTHFLVTVRFGSKCRATIRIVSFFNPF